MLKLLISFSLLFFVLASDPAIANSTECRNANPNSVTDVFNCAATATFGLYGTTNPFEKMQGRKAACISFRLIYQQVLIESGVDAKQVTEKLPNCEVVADVLFEFHGEEVLWKDCLGYDGTPSHMVTCLTGTIERAKPNAKAFDFATLNHCQLAIGMYEGLIKSVDSGKNTGFMPSYYKKVECNDYLNALTQSQALELEQNPCAGFEAASIETHAETCLMSDKTFIKANMDISCGSLRKEYQNRLLKVYGRSPDGYRLLSCGVMNEIKTKFASVK